MAKTAEMNMRRGKLTFLMVSKGQGSPAGQIAEEDEAQADIDRVYAVYSIGCPQENTRDEYAEYFFFGDRSCAREHRR